MTDARRTLAIWTLAAAFLSCTTTFLSCTTTGPSGPDQGTPPVSLSAAAIGFAPGETERSVTITNPGSSPIEWRVEGSASWLSVEPASGTLAPGSASLSLRVLRAGLAPGTYHSGLAIMAGDQELALDVTAEVDARPIASLDVTTVDFGTQLTSAQTQLTNTGNAPLAWSFAGPAWLVAQPSSGLLAPGTSMGVTLTVDRTGLATGVYTGTLTLSSDGGSSAVVMRLEVVLPAVLRVVPGALSFGSSSSTAGLSIFNDGAGALTWSLSSNRTWLSASATSGTVAPGTSEAVTVTVSREGLSTGPHSGTVTVTSNGGTKAVLATVDVEAPPPPPPPPPPPGSVALAGQLVDQFTGAAVAGANVSYQGGSATTDAAGRFSIAGAMSGSLQGLSISGPGIVGRATFARSSDTSWRAIPSSFDVNAFHDIAREYEPRTIRWMDNPSIYIDTRHVGGAAPELATWIAEARGAVEGFVSSWTNGAIVAGNVVVGPSPPEDGTAGWIIIRFDDDPSHYNGANTVGNARTGWSFQRTIVHSTVSLRFSLISGPSYANARTAVLGHELGHALGMGHMDGGTSSIMTPSVSIAFLSTFDGRAGSVLYSRSPGNTFPDVDTAQYYVGGLVPSAIPVGEHRWVCGAPELHLTP